MSAAADGSTPPPPPHIVLFPFLAQGHINPFISLAAELHRRHPTLAITLVSTAPAVDTIRASLPPAASRLRLHALSFSPDAFGLPPTTGTLASLRFDQFLTFCNASLSLLPGFEEFVEEISKESGRVSIVADFFFAWSVNVARKHGAFHSVLISSGCFGSAVFFSICTHLAENIRHGDEFHLPEYPEVVIHKTQIARYWLDDNLSKKWAEFLQPQILLCYKTDAMLTNTVEEVEFAGLGMLRKTFRMPVWPVGPLLHAPDTSAEKDSSIISWLDSRVVGSVLFVSFGSQNTIQAKQMMELALVLEAASRPFVWVIRPPVGFDVKAEFRPEWLPEGFEKRMGEEGKGLFVHGWAPQVSILAHKSTGAFLSHCGWNSSLESLVHGVPIIGWPLSGEQFYNVMMLEKWGAGVELARGNDVHSHVDSERVREVIELVMGESEKGKEIRSKAKEIKRLMENAWKDGGSSTNGLNEFLKNAGVPM